MNQIVDQDARNARARLLAAAKCNGIDFLLVRLQPAASPTQAVLEVHFFNDLLLAAIETQATTMPSTLWSMVPLSGGERYLAGPLSGQVQVTGVSHPSSGVLELAVEPIGDYSVYTLTVNNVGAAPPQFDPILSQIEFRFRPGCYSTDCNPPATPLAAEIQPTIDYLAKDFGSFRHVLTTAMMDRVPNWQSVTEADLDQVLIDLFCAAADELSDYQDRVMNEAYLAYARKRISIRRHARLMDYYIHEGNQSSSVLAVDTQDTIDHILASLTAWTGPDPTLPNTQFFLSSDSVNLLASLNRIAAYTWSGVVPALPVGATGADLSFASASTANAVAALITSGQLKRLLIQEWLNPMTGRPADADPTKRQILNLLPQAQVLFDPITSMSVVRIKWRDEDALKATYCFSVELTTGVVHDISMFHGNLVDVVQGSPAQAHHFTPGSTLPDDGISFYYEPLSNGATLCRLPNKPVLWTKTEPGGQVPSKSTVAVQISASGSIHKWVEQPDLIHSESIDRHFVVETDEDLHTQVRFGNGINGMAVPEDAEIQFMWLAGQGADGNVGRDAITSFNSPTLGGICWNPFDASDGLAPEPLSRIKRRVPEAFMYSQSRAVTLADYAQRAEEVPGVRAAVARYMWTGSWRTVRVCVEPIGTFDLSSTLRASVEQALEALHLIGEDIEIRPPELVPLNVKVSFCVSPDQWIEDVLPIVAQAFSSTLDSNGLPAFFNPSRWTFGQALYASQIEGVLQGIEGVEHVISIHMAHWFEPWISSFEVMKVGSTQVIEVLTDPSLIEHGWIEFEAKGGRQ